MPSFSNSSPMRRIELQIKRRGLHEPLLVAGQAREGGGKDIGEEKVHGISHREVSLYHGSAMP